MSWNEYGGYIELEYNRGPEFHQSAIPLNCGRGCLEYLVKQKKIQKIYIPYFLCASVDEVCKKCGVKTVFYHINEQLLPVIPDDLKADDWLYVVNYYGQLENSTVRRLKQMHKRLIVDNVQAFFQMPVSGVDTLYTCRKFFGVADGGYLYTDAPEVPLETDISYQRMEFLMGRLEKSASEFYGEYVDNNALFETEPVKKMSALTRNILRGVDYSFVSSRRSENFACLHQRLGRINQLQLQVPEGAFMYPLWIPNGSEIRKILQKKKIYIPTLWPDVFDICQEGELEYRLASDILPVPVDQRYDSKDMEFLADQLLAFGDT